jgi:cold shock CspA family protein
MNAAKLIGRVVSVNKKGDRPDADHTFGFIVTDDGREFFFHRDDVVQGRMPRKRSTVSFKPIKQTAEGKNDRAAEIDIISEPAHAADVQGEPASSRR